MLLSIVGRLVDERWSDHDISELILPAVEEFWKDEDAAEVKQRVHNQLAWVRRQEAAKSVHPMSDRAARNAQAFSGGRP